MKLAEFLEENPSFTPESAVQHLTNGSARTSGYSYREALFVASELGWPNLTPTGDRQRDVRRIIRLLAVTYKPFWSRLTPLGRERVRSVIDEDTEQALGYAGLWDTPPDRECVAWWDELSSHSRSLQEQALVELGRVAEELSLNYERERLQADSRFAALEPRWVSLDDNTLGYDISSWWLDATGTPAELAIEVKAIGSSRMRFFITRGEWSEAQSRESGSHEFHLWLLDDKALCIVWASDVGRHIPQDRGSGAWTSVEISANSFFNPS